MPRRRQINSGAAVPRLRSTVATATGPVREAAWAVEERLVWGGADLLRGIFDAAKWPFERLAWAVERRLVWPLQERIGGWSAPPRAAGVAAVALAAVGVVSLLLIDSGGGNATVARTVATRVAPSPPRQPIAQPAPTLHGAPPVFGAAPQAGAKTRAPAKAAHAAPAAATAKPADTSSATASAAPGEVAGPAAITVSRRFSDAFVRYETGQADAEVRAAFRATATPQLAASLLHRPPRLPANVEVPRAKVLNVVPGPSLGKDCTVSVSLLRVGLTSELRLSMHREKSGDWMVKDVLG
jgi:hypothetical protein